MPQTLHRSLTVWQKLRSNSKTQSDGRNGHAASSTVLPEETIGGRVGNLEVRLARTPRELRKAQSLRYKVFYREMAARADTKTRLFRRDEDQFDRICDHLVVLDHDVLTARKKPKIVGTYRLLRQEIAEKHDGFYTANEFDIAPLIRRHAHQNFLELGRSCVLPAYRGSRTVELLWHGIWSYVLAHKIDVMFGCASFPGTNPDDNAIALSFLHHHSIAENNWAVKALPSRRTSMDILPKAEFSARQALKHLPPLVKGYLRLGAKIGNGAVIDHQFGTTDVLIVLPVAEIDPRYIKHYGAEADRFAA
ncbi:MAG: GNAT family N-acetyltransferase [Hyphomicrobiales bacterium]